MTVRARTVARSLAPIALVGLAFGLAGCGGGDSGDSGGSGGAASSSSKSASNSAGAQVFSINCAVCHGATGHGDGVGAASLAVKPRNLTTEPYKYVDIKGHNNDETAALEAYIKVGRVESGMPPFGSVLSEEQLKDVAKYVESLRPKPNFVDEQAEEANKASDEKKAAEEKSGDNAGGADEKSGG